MVKASKIDETVEHTEEFAYLRMTPNEATILHAYLAKFNFPDMREYFKDDLIDLLENIKDALVTIVPTIAPNVSKTTEAVNKTENKPPVVVNKDKGKGIFE